MPWVVAVEMSQAMKPGAVALIAPFAAKDEQVTAERIDADRLLGFGRQTIEPVAQIDRPAGEIQLCSWRQADQVSPFMARGTRASAFSLTDASPASRVPFGSVISMAPVLSAPGADGGAGLGSRSGAAGTTTDMA